VKKIVIDPITRLEGHGKILLYLNENGTLRDAVLQVPELRGFEVFCRGRRGEEMPQITERICGVCPEAHHLASAKALDAAYGAKVPLPARLQRELFYNVYIFSDHLLHLVFLGGPDLLLSEDTPKEARNVLGVLQAFPELGRRVVTVRARAQRILEIIGGKAIHPCFALPGGVSRPLSPDQAKEVQDHARAVKALAQDMIQVFHEEVLPSPDYQALLAAPEATLATHYMGTVDENLAPNFYDGKIRAVSSQGKELFLLGAAEAIDQIGEHTEPWTYVKFPYVKALGWQGFFGGEDSGVYRVGPLARLNVAERMSTPLAQEEYERFFDFFGGKPVHATFAYHWARLVELVQAAEALASLAERKELVGGEVRGKLGNPGSGVGAVEAARGTLFHRYKLDGQGLVQAVDLIVATTHNAAALGLSVKQMAQAVVGRDGLDDALLNRVEMAFRAYDPCLACATHFLPGQAPLVVEIYDAHGKRTRVLRR